MIRADSYGALVFSYDEIKSWPDGELERMVGYGLLKPIEPSNIVICDGCEDKCQAEVIYRPKKEGNLQQGYVVCPYKEEMGPVPVKLDRLRQWEINLPVVAHGLTSLVGFTYNIDELIYSRLWYLGAPYIEGSRIDLFLARGVAWPDSQDVFGSVGRIKECAEPIILVPDEVPSPHPFTNAGRILSLGRLLYIDDNGIQIRTSELGAVIDKARRKRTRIIKHIQVKPGTRWEDIFFEFPSDDAIHITGPSITENRSYASLGFENLQTRNTLDRNQSVLWQLLVIFAKHGGEMTWEDARKQVHSQFDTVKKRFSRLREKLCSIFPEIEDKKPISNHSKGIGWASKINLIYSGEYHLHKL